MTGVAHTRPGKGIVPKCPSALFTVKSSEESVLGNSPAAPLKPGSQEQNETSGHDSEKEESRWKPKTFSL